MALRDIALALDGRRESGMALRVAVMLALRHGARLTAYACAAPGASALPEATLDVAVAAASTLPSSAESERARGLLDKAAEIAARVGLVEGLHRQLLSGFPQDVLPAAVQLSDLAIVAQQDEQRLGEQGILPTDLLAAETLPVLTVPSGFDGRPVGRRVLLGWNGSAACARAARAALPLLQSAELVRVLHVPESHSPATPAEAAVLFLQRRGVTVELAAPMPAGALDHGIGAALLGAAADLGADLLVAGAAHRHGLKELIWGNATTHLLAHAHLPVLSHR